MRSEGKTYQLVIEDLFISSWEMLSSLETEIHTEKSI